MVFPAMPPRKSTTASRTGSRSAARAASSAPASDAAANVHVFFGTDDLSATKAADALVDRLCPPENRDFGLERLEPETTTPTADASAALLERTLGALLTPPFLGGDKTVYLRNAPFFEPRKEPGKFGDVVSRVERLTALLAKGLPPSVHFVVLAPGVDKTTAFYKTLSKAGAHFAETNLAKYARDAAESFYPALEAALRDENLTLKGDARTAFVDRVGFSTRQAVNEIQKLSAYLGPDRRAVTLEDIQLMVAPSAESNPWDFAEAYTSCSVTRTLSTLDRLVFQKVDPIGQLIMLEGRLRDMVLFADLLARRVAVLGGSEDWPTLAWRDVPPDLDALLSSMEKDPRGYSRFTAPKLARDAARLAPARWYRFLNAAVDVHAAMTGDSTLAPRLALELFVVRTIGSLTKSGRRPA